MRAARLGIVDQDVQRAPVPLRPVEQSPSDQGWSVRTQGLAAGRLDPAGAIIGNSPLQASCALTSHRLLSPRRDKGVAHMPRQAGGSDSLMRWTIAAIVVP